MSIEIKVPVLPESVTDATVATWHKQAGDSIRRDENLVDLETDKVVLEVPAPCDGVLKTIDKDSGAVVISDEILATIEEGQVAAETIPEAASPTPSSPEAPKASAAKPDQAELGPAVRKLIVEKGLDPASIVGSGRDGRITKEDVLAYLQGSSKQAPEPTVEPPVAVAVNVPTGSRGEERVPMSRLRARIAERMVEAQNTAAMLTSFNEVDLKAVMDIRRRYKESFEKRHGVKLGLMSFFVMACCDALKKYPVVNATVDGNDIIYHGYQDVGIAVSTDRGLVVPVLRNGEQMSLAEVEQGIRDYATRAREGSIKLEDLQGGTFTITNGGVFGSLVSTPILNMPQSAILGMHTIKDRPVVVDGEIVARPMMYIALTYDHRIVDGRDAVLFLVAVKDALEDPTRMLLNL